MTYDAEVVQCLCEASRHISDAQTEIVGLLESGKIPDPSGIQIFESLAGALAVIGKGLGHELRKR